ncbi:MAG: signal peptidase II [Myxococcaceae bacterium]
MARRYVLFLVVTLAVVFLDHWTKYLAVEHLTSFFDAHEGVSAELGALYGDPPPQAGVFHYPPRGKVEVIDGLLRFRYAENPGAAWGLFRTLPPNVRGPLFHVVTIGAVILIFGFFRTLTGKPEEKWAVWGLPLILGGALGNYIDRIARAFVIDFIEAHWFDKAYWPAFNIADAAICIGVGCMVVDSFVRKPAPAVETGAAS